MQQPITLTPNRQQQEHVIANFNLLMIRMAIAIAAATLLFATPDPWVWNTYLPRVGGLLLFGIAAMVTGGLLGLIFGVPKSNRRNTAPSSTIGADGTQATLPYGGNSNLEEISDWLTKMIVGIALINWQGIGAALGSLKDQLTESLDTSFAGFMAMGLIGAYVGLGFTLGYVWSRIFLPRLLSNAERSDFDALSRDHRAVVELETMLNGRAQPDAQSVSTLYDNASPAGRQRVYDQVIHTMMQKIEVGSKMDELVPIFDGLMQVSGFQNDVFRTAEYAVVLLNSTGGQTGTKYAQAKDYLNRWDHAVQRNPAMKQYLGTPLLSAHLALVKVIDGAKPTDKEVVDLLAAGRRDVRVGEWLRRHSL